MPAGALIVPSRNLSGPGLPFAQARPARLLTLAAALTAAIALLATALSPPAHAEGPGSGSPWVASLGDSYISRRGRPLGRQHQRKLLLRVDALGSSAYYDNASGHTGENDRRLSPLDSRPRCTSADGVSGDQPGLLGRQDIELQHRRRRVQARARLLQLRRPRRPGADAPALRRQRTTSSWSAISIGGNNFNFAGIVQDCIEDFLLSPEWWPAYCSEESSVTEELQLHATSPRSEGGDHGRDRERCHRR